MIFVERDTPLSAEEIQRKLDMLKEACDTGDDQVAKETLRKVVPTFKKPEEVNKKVASLEEKKERKKTGIKVAMKHKKGFYEKYIKRPQDFLCALLACPEKN